VGESGTPHLQGYIAFTHKKQRSTVARLVSDRAHLERTLGTPTQASSYCTDVQKRDPDNMEILHVYGQLDEVLNLTITEAAPDAMLIAPTEVSKYFISPVAYTPRFLATVL